MSEFRDGLREAIDGAGLKMKPEEEVEANREFLVSGHPLAAGTVGGIQGFLTRDIMNVKRQELGGIKNAMYSSTPLVAPRSNPVSAPSTGSPRRGAVGSLGESDTLVKSPRKSVTGA